jgi:hypothetical protein
MNNCDCRSKNMAGWLDRYFNRARAARSDAELEQIKRDFEHELPPSLREGETHRTDDGLSIGTGEDGTHLHLHLGGGGGQAGGGAMPGMTGDEPPPNGAPPAAAASGSPNAAGGDVNTRVAALEAAVATLTQQVAEITGGNGGENGEEVELQDPDTKDARSYIMRRRRRSVGDEGDLPTPERNPDMIYETDLPGIEDLDGRRARSGESGGIGDRRSVGDSFNMETVWQETMAKGEIIVPGIRVPTFDGRVNQTITARRLCSFRRQTMDAAIRDENIKGLVETVTNIKNPEVFKTMRCDTLKMAFDVTAGAIGGNRNAGVMRASVGDGASRPAQGQRGSPSIAELQRRNREAWKTGEFKKPTIQ